MIKYTCPICNKKMPRDLLIYMDHQQEHVVEEIKKKHPEWVEKNGLCKKCVDYYKRSIKGQT